jgi:hypothetical protein
MKIYLEDERPTPDGWLGVRWPDEVIAHLETGLVTDVSLDHDLGDDERDTGYDVVLWLEEAVALRGFVPLLANRSPVLIQHAQGHKLACAVRTLVVDFVAA